MKEQDNILFQEAVYEDKLSKYKDMLHEEEMFNDIDYFCEHIINNLTIFCNNSKEIYFIDMLEEVKNMCIKYNHDINYVLDYFKDIL